MPRERVYVPPQAIPEAGGLYVLVLRQRRELLRTRIGALGLREFPRGYYCYTGSARGGLRGRLARHLCRSGKSLHWHIDYLRRRTAIAGLACWPGGVGECDLADAVRALGGAPVPRFGCSDCDCPSHLYRFDRAPLEALARMERGGVPALVLPGRSEP
jgi:sugar fermentation stimulation protein A